MQRPDLVPLDSNQMSNIWDLYRTHPTVGCCVQVFRNSLLGEGLRINATSDHVGPFDEGTKKLCTLRYEHVAGDAMDWLICSGVVPVVFQWVPHITRYLPVVPQPETVKLFVRVDSNGDRHYEGILERGNSILSSVVTGVVPENAAQAPVRVWGGGEYLPTSRGKIITPITKLETSERFLSMLRENVLVATHRMANPALVTQPRAKRNTDQDGIMWNVDDQTAQDAEFSRLEKVANQDSQEANLRSQCWGGVGIPSTEPEKQQFSDRCKTHEYFLPSERELVTPQSAAYPAHYVELVRQCDEKIYQIFGIPHAMFSNSGTSLQSNFMQMYSLNVNMRRMMAQLQKFLQEVWVLADRMGADLRDQLAKPLRQPADKTQSQAGNQTLRGNDASAATTFFEVTQHVPEDIEASALQMVTDKAVTKQSSQATQQANSKQKNKKQEKDPMLDEEKQARKQEDSRRDGMVYQTRLPEQEDLDTVKDQKRKLEDEVELKDFDEEADAAKHKRMKETGRLEGKELQDAEDTETPDESYMNPFENALNEYTEYPNQGPHSAPITLIATPCIQTNEVQQQMDSGVLSVAEAINIQRGALGLPLLTEAQAKKQKEEADKRMVDLEKQLSKPRESAKPNDQAKKDTTSKPTAKKSSSTPNKTPDAPKPSTNKSAQPQAPKVVLEVKTAKM